jgi:hypothetical protein
MTATTRVAAAVATGYLLGRTKKLKLAFTVGSMLAGSRMAGNVKPGALIQSLSENPEVKRLQDQLRGQVLAAAKSAATNVASSKLEALNESLQNGGRSKVERPEDEEAPGGDEPEDQADEPEDQSDEPADESQDEGEKEKPRPSRRPRKRSESAGGSDSSGRSVGSGSSTAKRPARKKTAASTAKRPARKKAASASTGR